MFSQINAKHIPNLATIVYSKRERVKYEKKFKETGVVEGDRNK